MTKEELEKIRAKFLQLEQDLEENIALYKADGKISKEERLKIKSAKKSLIIVKKALKIAIRSFKKEQKAKLKSNKNKSSSSSQQTSSGDNSATFVGSHPVGTGTFITLDNDLDKLIARAIAINNTIVSKQHYNFMPATNLASNKNLQAFQKLVKELGDILKQILSVFDTVKENLPEKQLKKYERKIEGVKRDYKTFSPQLPRHLAAQKELESSFKTNRDGETVLDLGEPALPDNLRRKPVYEIFDLPVFEGNEEDFCQIASNDVEQLKNGNCTLIAALMQIASKEPKLIKKAIQPKGETTKKGKVIKKYAVTLYLPQKDKAGKKVKVLVSNEFYSSGDGVPFFTGKGDDEIWVLLIEKAVASLLGGYAIFENDGYSLNLILSVLTGQPSPRVNLLSEEEMDEEKLRAWFIANQNKVITVADTTHAYSVSDINLDSSIITLIDPLTLKELRYDISTIKNKFAEVASVSLTVDKDCPDDMVNTSAKPVKVVSTINSFLKMSKEHQIILLEAKDNIQWRTIRAGASTVTKVDKDFVYLDIEGVVEEISLAELTDWKFQPIIKPAQLGNVLTEVVYVTWTTKDGNEWTFDSAYNGLLGFETTLEGFIEISSDEVYQKFGILKK